MDETLVLDSEEEVEVLEEELDELDEFSEEFIEDLIDKILEFTYLLAGHPLHAYQTPFARRIIRSVLINDGSLLTALAARQSGKSEILANVVAALMVLLPRLAKIYPDLLGKFADGFWVGMFAPIEAQAETLFGRTVVRLSSERALEILGDPEIDDSPGKNPGVTRGIRLKKSGSMLLMMTANPRAKIESKSFHLIIIDECQDVDDFIVSKSISPMGAYYNACVIGSTRVLMADGSLLPIEDLVAERPADACVMAPATEDLSDGSLVSRKVEAYHDNGVQPTLRVSLRGGREVTSTHNHRYMVAKNLRSDRNAWEWRRADELRVGDRIAVPWQPVDTGKPVETTFPELLGWIISEGCITGYGGRNAKWTNGGQVRIAQTVPDLVQDISELVEAYDEDSYFKHSGRQGLVQYRTPRSRPGPLKRELIRLGLWGLSAKDKFIPDECFEWNNEAVARLLSRLFAGDGCLHNGTTVPVIKYTTISARLAEGIRHLLDRVGVYSTVNTSVVPQSGNTAYTTTIADPVSQRRFLDTVGWMKASNDLPGFRERLDRACKFRTDLGMRYEKVLSVEDAGEQHTYDIQVAESHCYITGGVVSHNTMVKTGTPTTKKNNFYKSIQINKRTQVAKASRRNHFEWNWKDVVKVNPNYKKYIRKEMLQLGEDSDEFQMSYCCKWMLDRGMFISQSMFEELGDTSQQIVKGWNQSPVVVGIDPARKVDSTVVTVLWVNWDYPDEFGYFEHRILNWLEIQGDDWEEQYFQIVNFLAPYDVLAVGVDATGVGDAVAQRLKLLLPRSEVMSFGSNQAEQAKRWKHLSALIQRRALGWPAHAKTRRLKVYQRFMQQMLDAEKKFTGQYFTVEAPNEAGAHDDFVDSLAIAAYCTAEMHIPHVDVSSAPWFD